MKQSNSPTIKIIINDILTTIFIGICRKKKTVYNKLVVNLLAIMTTKQITDIILTHNNKHYITFQDILNSFAYHGEVVTDTNRCICCVPISYCYSISNKTTLKSYIVGSTCCKNWIDKYELCDRTTPDELKAKKKKILLKKCFNGLKNNCNLGNRIPIGKHKNKLISSLVANYKGYCNWILEKFDDNTANKQIKCDILQQQKLMC
jgi:hypothetical protein